MITIEQFTELAHRTASRYSHRSEPARAFYTFSPEALADLHRQVCAAVAQAQRVPDRWPNDADLTAIYKQANGEDVGKAQPLTTQRIFKAMRAMLASSPAPAKHQEPPQQERGPMTEESDDDKLVDRAIEDLVMQRYGIRKD